MQEALSKAKTTGEKEPEQKVLDGFLHELNLKERIKPRGAGTF